MNLSLIHIYFKDYSEYQDKYDSLKADEKRLDRLFEKTCYAKEIDEMEMCIRDRYKGV